MRTNSKVVLITGASSGIGVATAERVAAAGHQVVIGARRADRLAAVAEKIRAKGGAVDDVALDVTDTESVYAFVRTAEARYGRINVLFNNAGVMSLSRFDALRVDEWNQMIDVNVKGVLNAIAAVLPVMKKQGSGQIVNMTSVLGRIEVTPNTAVYSATKAAVHALSDGLRRESQEIRVSEISTSFVESEIMTLGGEPNTMAWARDLASKLNMPPSSIADAVAYAIDQPDDVDINEIIVRPTVQAG